MSIKISSRKSAPLVIKPSRPAYTNDDEDEEVETGIEEDQEYKGYKEENKDYDDDYDDKDDYTETNNNEEDETISKGDNDNEQKLYENGVNDHRTGVDDSPSNQPIVPPRTTKKPTHIRPTSVAPALLHKREKVWPPPAPKTYDAFAVEGHGRNESIYRGTYTR